MSFVCHIVDPVSMEDFWGVGETVQEAWENLLSDNDFLEEDINQDFVTFFKQVDVIQETRVTWELA